MTAKLPKAFPAFYDFDARERAYHESLSFRPGRGYLFPSGTVCWDLGSGEVRTIAKGEFRYRSQLHRYDVFQVWVGRREHLVAVFVTDPTCLPVALNWWQSWSLSDITHLRFRRPKKGWLRTPFVGKKDARYRFSPPLRQVPTLAARSGCTIGGDSGQLLPVVEEVEFIAAVVLAGEFIFRTRDERGHWQYFMVGFSEEDPTPDEIVETTE